MGPEGIDKGLLHCPFVLQVVPVLPWQLPLPHAQLVVGPCRTWRGLQVEGCLLRWLPVLVLGLVALLVFLLVVLVVFVVLLVVEVQTQKLAKTQQKTMFSSSRCSRKTAVDRRWHR